MGNAPLDRPRKSHHKSHYSEHDIHLGLDNPNRDANNEDQDVDDVDAADYVNDDEEDETEEERIAKAKFVAALKQESGSSTDTEKTNKGQTQQTQTQDDPHQNRHRRSATQPNMTRRPSLLNRMGINFGSKKSVNDSVSTTSMTTGTASSSVKSYSPPSSPKNKKIPPLPTIPSKASDSRSEPGLTKSASQKTMTQAPNPIAPLPPKLSGLGLPPLNPGMSLSIDSINAEANTFGIDLQRQTQKSSTCSEEASQIRPYLYLAGDLVAKNMDQLRSIKVTNIINAAPSVCDNYFHDKGLEYLSFDLMDANEENISVFFLRTIAEIEKARKRNGVTLVHCQQGISRSSALIMAYLMWAEKMSFEEGWSQLRKVRSVCAPNVGFVAQLKDWEAKLNSSPTKPTLFRIGPHSDRNKALVARPILSNLSVLSSSPLGTNPASATASGPSPQSKGSLRSVGFAEPNSDSASQNSVGSDPSTAANKARSGSILRRSSLVNGTRPNGEMPANNEAEQISTAQSTPAPTMAVRRRRSVAGKPVPKIVKFPVQSINKKEVYLLHIPNPSVLFVWVGKECPRMEEYVAAAKEQTDLMVQYDPHFKGSKVIKVKSQSREEADSLLSTASSSGDKAQMELEVLYWKSLDGIEVSESEL